MRMILPTRPTPCQSTERSTLFEVTFRAGNLVIQERHAVRFNERFGYAYDAAMTMRKASNNVFQQSFNVNSLNAITNTYRAGTLTVAGTTTSPATNVTVKYNSHLQTGVEQSWHMTGKVDPNVPVTS